MKTIGIIGGMSWESSAEYYRLINETVRSRLGPSHSAELILYSVDFHDAAQLEQQEQWPELATLLIDAATRLEKAGADFVLMASNTAHRVADAVQRSIHAPLLHIADVCAEEIASSGFSRVGLLGTQIVMEQDFYKERFRANGIGVVLPGEGERDYVHNVISMSCARENWSQNPKKGFEPRSLTFSAPAQMRWSSHARNFRC